MTEIKRSTFTVSLHYEIFFALQTLTDPQARIHPGWTSREMTQLPASFSTRLKAVGSSPFLWPCIADCIQGEDRCYEWKDLLKQLREVPISVFQERLLIGILHDPSIVRSILSGHRSIQEAVSRVPASKRQWLAFIGLYPYEKSAPLAKALQSLLRNPAEFRKNIIALLTDFWESCFQATWHGMRSQLEHSCREKERLFHSCSLQEFAQQTLLRVEVSERAGFLKAVRGGFRLRLKDIGAAYFFPSAFNDQRHWTCYGPAGKMTACFPYFDPSLSLDFAGKSATGVLAAPEPDPALILSALGDHTRFAIASMLARDTVSSADLARSLGLTPATVSHHIHVLREAGLLQEAREGATVCLSLNRAILEQLSQLVINKLFHSDERLQLRKTRTL